MKSHRFKHDISGDRCGLSSVAQVDRRRNGCGSEAVAQNLPSVFVRVKLEYASAESFNEQLQRPTS